MSLVFVVEENTKLLLKMSERTTTAQVVKPWRTALCVYLVLATLYSVTVVLKLFQHYDLLPLRHSLTNP